MSTVFEDMNGRQFKCEGAWWYSRDLDSGWSIARDWLRSSPQYNGEVRAAFNRGELTPVKT